MGVTSCHAGLLGPSIIAESANSKTCPHGRHGFRPRVHCSKSVSFREVTYAVLKTLKFVRQ